MTGRAEHGARPEVAFGPRLRRFREAAGLSQVALAGSDLHPSYVSLLEAGRRTPTADAVAVLAARIGITPEELTGEVATGLEEPVVLAESAIGLGRPAEAIELLEPVSGGFGAERCRTDPLTFRAAQAYATALESVGRLDDATVLLEVLLEVARTASTRLPWLDVSVALVRCYRDSGDLSRAIDVGERTAELCRGLPSAKLDGHAALTSTLAGVYAERGDLMRAEMLLDGLLTEVSASGTLEEQAFAYWNAAINAAERGNARHGLLLAEQAAALLSVGSDLRAQSRLQVSRAWVHLAQTPPEPAPARALLREALPLLRQYSGALGVACAETELARCELLLGRPDIARRHAQSALKRLSDEHRIERARALTALGASLVALDERALGVATLEQAALALDRVQAPRQAASVWRQLSSVFRSLGDTGRALDAADRALDGAGVPADVVVPEAAPAQPRSVPSVPTTH